MIENYSFGFVIIDGKNYQHDIWIDSLGNVKDWIKRESHLVEKEDIEEVVKEEPGFLVIGTGAYGVTKITEEVKKALFCLKIEIIAAETGEAVKEYNRLSQEGKKVSALLHLTC